MRNLYLKPYLFRRWRYALLILLYVLVHTLAFSQSSINGRLRDTIMGQECALATITVLSPDSSVVQFARSHKDGGFEFSNVSPGLYFLLITHPHYEPYSTSIDIMPNQVLKMGIVFLTPRADSLAAFIVTANQGPRFKGDTLEYNTANIKSRMNATVEELLGRLPGVQVDQNGGITVNGQKIEKLLVDGKEFFGDDPTIATKNLNADMISKAQVLNKKNKQAEFTGVDDGQRVKTLNLVLKEDSKRGFFLKAEAGDDAQQYYNLQAFLGSFNGDRQLAVLGMMSNTGGTGFNSSLGDFGSRLNIGGGNFDALNASAGAGVPKVGGCAVQYSNGWNKESSHLGGYYGYGTLVTDPISSFFSQQTLPGSLYIQRKQASSHNVMEQHNLNTTYELIIDTLSAFSFSFNSKFSKGDNFLNSYSYNSFNDTMVNSDQRSIRSDVSNTYFEGNIIWRTRSRKSEARVFSITAGLTEQNNSTNGYIYALNSFYEPNGTLQKIDTTDQRKSVNLKNNIITTSANYTIPIWKNTILAWSYGVSYNNNVSYQSTFSGTNGKYATLVDTLSNSYRNELLTQQLTVNLQSQSGRSTVFTYLVGADIAKYAYKQHNLIADSVLRYQYINFLPKIDAKLNINGKKMLNFLYNGNAQQPTIEQLQPVANNNDPLFILKGNPQLHASFIHKGSLTYISIRHMTLNAGLNFNIVSNDITSKTYVDSSGKQIMQYVNTNGNYNAGINLGCWGYIKSLGININFSTGATYGRNVNYINGYLNHNSNYMLSEGVSINKYVHEKYNFQINEAINYNFTNSSINTAIPVKYWSHNGNGRVAIYFFTRMEFNTTVSYTWRQKLDNFSKDDFTVIWNAYLGMNMFKNQLTVRWQANNILGQNVGIYRGISANQVSETNTNMLGRYWMFSASWRMVKHSKLNN